MEENWAEALQNVEDVWRRVQGKDTAQPESGVEERVTMEQLMQSEADGAQQYRLIAGLAAGRSAETLQTMAAECRQGLKQLQTEFFMETGDTFVPQKMPMETDGLLGYLRRAYLQEGKNANRYLMAAASAQREPLRQLYGGLARRCTARQEKLYALAGVVLG